MHRVRYHFTGPSGTTVKRQNLSASVGPRTVGPGGGAIAASKNRIVDYQPKGKCDVPRVGSALIRDWRVASITTYDQAKLVDLKSSNVEASNLTRNLFGTFAEYSTYSNPEITVVSLSGGIQVQVACMNPALPATWFNCPLLKAHITSLRPSTLAMSSTSNGSAASPSTTTTH